MTRILPPEKVKKIYESKIRKLAYAKWEEAGRPTGRELEFWLLAEKEQREKDEHFYRRLTEAALPNYDCNIDTGILSIYKNKTIN